MEESKVLFKIYLDNDLHKRTGNTNHSVDGELIKTLPAYLQIESNPLVEGEFYLIHYDQDGEDLLTDTLHDSVGHAMNQAEFEFGVSSSQWEELE